MRKIAIGMLALLIIVASTIYIYPEISERMIWWELNRKVPRASIQQSESGKTQSGVFAEFLVQGYEVFEVGHVSIANGDTWRFAFMSHHGLPSSESLSVFKGPQGTFRVRGSWYYASINLFRV